MKRLNREQVARAEAALRQADPRFDAVIDQHGPCTLGRTPPRPFHTLARAIIGQQVSARAAATICQRVVHASGARKILSAQRLATLSDARLRAAGLSGNKSRYLAHLAAEVESGRLELARLGDLDNAEITARLTQLPGIGPWTAEMFLMFGLHRPDVLSVADVGLRRGVQQLHGYQARPDAAAFRAIAEPWRPWRTVACWYLWRLVD